MVFRLCVSSLEYLEKVTAHIPSMATASGAQRFGGEISSVYRCVMCMSANSKLCETNRVRGDMVSNRSHV